MNNKNILIFVPNTLENTKKGILEGFSILKNECDAYFIINNIVLNENSNTEKCIGYVGDIKPNFKENKLFYNIENDKITLNNSDCDEIIIYYDYNKFSDSDIDLNNNADYNDYFQALRSELKKKKYKNDKKKQNASLLYIIYIVTYILSMLKYAEKVILISATLQHFENSLKNFLWFISTLNKNKKMSCKSNNLLFTKLVDLILGFIFLYYFIENQNIILNSIENMTENIVKNLKGLLLYLMGSPIGLKLNNAFNNSLGKFFFYHINLWRIFLQLLHPILCVYYKYLIFPATFGLSYQVAMLSDLVSIATFHVYCIYVYAARIFSLQIRGLTSLWRLFIGRKVNPLRNRVDSCEYSQNQLFIGTLGFAVLLFLLPTTVMYYCIFVTFRLVMLGVVVMLSKVRYFLDSMPVYVVVLWILGSSKLAGSLCIRLDEKNSNYIYADLNILSFYEIIFKFCPDSIKKIENNSIGSIFKNVIIGVLI